MSNDIFLSSAKQKTKVFALRILSFLSSLLHFLGAILFPFLPPLFSTMFRVWWPTSSKHMADAEAELLRGVLSSPHLTVTQRFVDVFPKHSLNTMEIVRSMHKSNSKLSKEMNDVEDAGQKPESQRKYNTLVMTHGFGSGIGLWYRNLEPIVTESKSDLKIIAFDWPGFGRSSRVRWDIEEFSSHVTHPNAFYDEPPQGDEEREDDLHHYHNEVEPPILRRLRQTENFFIESLEKWREEMKLEEFILLGHSLGGYFASVYALRYPHRIKTLILASPAGIPPPPPNPPQYRSALFKTAIRLWNWRVAPQSAVRLAGPFGASLVDKAAKWRFDLEGDDAELVSNYLYHISAAPPSGERVLFDVLAPGAYAHSPLQLRLNHLNKNMNICFIYGQYDWMDYRAAVPICQAIGPRAHLFLVDDAGHQLYLENTDAFNRLIVHICDHSNGHIPPPRIADVYC
jgi:cardiolipin-specific phospholipase